MLTIRTISTVVMICASSVSAQRMSVQGHLALPYDFAGKQAPVWTNGGLVFIDKNDTATPVIHLVSESGQESTPTVLAIPGAKATRIAQVARGLNGSYAAVGSTFDSSGRGGGFVAWISPDRQTVNVGRPFPYVPFQVAIAGDGSVWTQGAEMVNGNENNSAINRSHGVIRHFDTSGKQLSDYLPRAGLFGGKWMGLPQGSFAIAGDRVGWYARVAQRYFEVNFDGTTSNYSGVSPNNSKQRVAALTLAGDGTPVVGLLANDHSTSLYALDRNANVWAPIALPGDGDSEGRLLLLGGDEKRLVFGDGSPRLSFYAINK